VPGALPSGTVAFLFTDIAGSTKLLDDLGAQGYAEALERHRAVIRAALDAHGGVEVDNQGDAFFCAFESPQDAVACANAARVALEATPIRVRMGVHTGEAIVAGDRYVGLEVHRAARIGACGHGGQIVVSPTTAALLEPGTVELRDLGEHWLKDLDTPIRLFQLGEGDFPSLKTLYRTKLPIPATAFVGRDRETAELVDLASRSETRLLTLTGPGGTGKTRLALHVVGELAGGFADGVFWVPLAPLRDAGLVASAVAEAVGVVEEPGISLEQTLERETAGRRMLVLLDNCEHVLEGTGRVAPGLVRAGTFVIATSRERLALNGERVYPVDPLEREDAIALYAARAEAAGGILEPTAETREAVDALCQHLDDLPLALELAAPRAALLPPAALLQSLSDRLDVLSGPRDAEERQRTLRATIAWSYDLLKPSEKAVFRRLAVFVGSARLDAVESICEADLEDLLSLVAKSLVRRRATDGAPVFWLLETVREFALTELEAVGDADATRDRHLDWFLAQARRDDVLETAGISESFGRAVRGRLDELERDIDNFRAAFSWALTRARVSPRAAADAYSGAVVSLAAALRPFYAVRGRFAEAQDVLGAALPYAVEPITAARLRSWLAQAMRGRRDDAWSLHVEAEKALAREADRTSARWWSAWLDVKLAQAHHHYWTNNPEALAETAEELRPDLERHGTPAQRIDWLSVLLKEIYLRQRYALTEDSDELADAFYRASVDIGDRYADFQRGFHLLWRGKLNDALSHFATARDVARDVGDAVMEVRCLIYSAIARRKQGDVEGAQVLLDELGGIRERHGYDGLYAANRAWVAWRQGELEEVERRAAEALADWARPGRSRPTVFQWTARFPQLAAELVRGRSEAALEQAGWLIDRSQQPLPAGLHRLVREALQRHDAGPLSRAVELGRGHGYT
jgi:predicted ATPase/class 3 adenylate cyclase